MQYVEVNSEVGYTTPLFENGSAVSNNMGNNKQAHGVVPSPFEATNTEEESKER